MTIITNYILNTLLISIYQIVPLAHPLSILKILVIFLCNFLMVVFLSPYGQITVLPSLIIAFLLICLLTHSGYKLLNVCCAIWGYLCAVLINYFSLIVLEFFFHLTVQQLDGQILFNLAQICFVFIALYVFQYCIRHKLRLVERQLSNSLLISCLFLLSICCIIFVLNFVYGESIGYPPDIIRLNTVLYIAFFASAGILLYRIIREVLQNQEYKQRLEALSIALEYSQNLEHSYQELHKFKHDYKNLLISLSGCIERGDLSNIRNYLSEILLPFSEQLDTASKQVDLSLLEIPEVKGLVLNKLLTAKHLGISVTCFLPKTVSSIQMELLDLIRLLGIYFDNAITAASRSKEKQLEFHLFPENGHLILTLINSYENPALIPEHLSGNGYSTKPGHQGMGLSIVQTILKKYPLIYHSTQVTDKYVIQQLQFPK